VKPLTDESAKLALVEEIVEIAVSGKLGRRQL
jgi:hypothetical protein